MEETTPRAPKKIRLTRAEVYAMGISSPRKKKLTFGLVGLLLVAAMGSGLWHFQEVWLPYWFPSTQEPWAPAAAQATVESTANPMAMTSAEPPPAAALGSELDFLSAAAWDHPQFLRGIRLFNRALDLHRLFLSDRSLALLPAQVEEGALQAALAFDGLRAEAPPAVPLGDYIARCRRLVVEIRRLSRLATAPAAATQPPSPSTPRPEEPPTRPGEPWQNPDYLQGARLFNRALEQYQLFLADKSRTERLKPIEEDAFQAAKKFEALRGQEPEHIPLGDHINQCYKLIADCRRQNLESASPETGKPLGNGLAGPSHRPALPAYPPPQ